MCGACGQVVVADPVFPDGRTTRGNLIAAQIIEALCAGRIKVAGRSEGFVVSAPGHRPVLCATVAEMWTAVRAAVPAAVFDVPPEIADRYAGEQALLDAIVATAPIGCLRRVATTR
jgi:hypothetical protein